MPVSNFTTPEKYRYNSGFATYQETEALDGALPIGQNSPQKPPFGLYTEKISGSPFQAPRDENQQTWTYRIIPSAAHKPFEPEDDTVSLQKARNYNDYKNTLHIPTQTRWDPFDINEELDWVHSMHLLCGAGDTSTKTGLGYFIFTAGKSMDPYSAFSSSDGELLIIPQQGVLDIRTELGCILVRPLEICVIPRGIKYNVSLPEGPARGYAAELHQGVFTLPNLGAIGSSGLANTRDFQIPVASYYDGLEYACKIYCKYNGRLFVAEQDHSPFDVVAWHGLYYPYKYDLGRFLTIGSISYDHPDPSIFTVLASTQGIAELAIFPPRWLVMEDTFRPPWYHRNALAEIMGLIQGEYEARNKGFLPGGASLHNVFVAHGPDATVHDKASKQDLVPQKVGAGSMAFVFESTMLMGMSEWAWETSNKRQSTYNADTWLPLKSLFNGPTSVKANSHLLSASTNGGGNDAADGVGEDY